MKILTLLYYSRLTDRAQKQHVLTCGGIRVCFCPHQLLLVEAGQQVLHLWVVVVPEEQHRTGPEMHHCSGRNKTNDRPQWECYLDLVQ